jgi:hypothetical protein
MAIEAAAHRIAVGVEQAAPRRDHGAATVGDERAALCDERHRHARHAEDRGCRFGNPIAGTPWPVWRVAPSVKIPVDGDDFLRSPLAAQGEGWHDVAHPEVIDRCVDHGHVRASSKLPARFTIARAASCQQTHRLIARDRLNDLAEVTSCWQSACPIRGEPPSHPAAFMRFSLTRNTDIHFYFVLAFSILHRCQNCNALKNSTQIILKSQLIKATYECSLTGSRLPSNFRNGSTLSKKPQLCRWLKFKLQQ